MQNEEFAEMIKQAVKQGFKEAQRELEEEKSLRAVRMTAASVRPSSVWTTTAGEVEDPLTATEIKNRWLK